MATNIGSVSVTPVHDKWQIDIHDEHPLKSTHISQFSVLECVNGCHTIIISEFCHLPQIMFYYR